MLTEEQNQRDRSLARDTGILIGYNRAEARKKALDRAWTRGFVIGFLVGLLLVTIGVLGAERASANHTTTKAAKIHRTAGWKHERHIPAKAVRDAIVKIGQCEQPAPRGAGYWMNIKWDAFPGKTWPGGLGIMQIHHEQFRPKGTPKDPTKATPAQQIRTAWRAYKYYRNIYGVGGGATFWDCSRKSGFGGVLYDNRTVVWR